MNPRHLRTFLAVRKHLNYTRAAEEVFLSQPAVSRQMRQLEGDLGVSLFEQIGKSLHLTDAGRTLAPEAEKLLGAMERATEAVRAHRSPEQGTLRVGASTTPGLYLLPDLLGRFHRRHPQVALRYSVENSLSIERMIVGNELDLGFVGAHLTNRDLVLKPVVEDEIVCYAHPAHRLARKRRVAVSDLDGETWVLREKGSATRQLFESWLAAKGGRIGPAIELHCPEAAKILIAAGVGFSFMSLNGLKDEFRARRLKRVRLSGLNLTRPIYLVHHADKHASPVMETFLEMVQAGLAGHR